MAFRAEAEAPFASPAPASYLPTSQQQQRKASPKEKSSSGFFSKRLSIFGGKHDSPSSSRPVSVISISSPVADSFVDLSAETSPTSTSPSSRASSTAPSSPYLYERPSRPYSVASFAFPTETRTSSPASSMFASQQPKRVRRKPVPSYIDLSDSMDKLTVDIVGLGRLQDDSAEKETRKDHKRSPSLGTEGMWASGRDSYMCRELESPLHELEEEGKEEDLEEMRDGLWTTSSDLTSSGMVDSHRSTPSRQSSLSSFSSLRVSPCLSSAPFRPPRSPQRSHSRASSSVSYQSIQIPPSPALGSLRHVSRKTSWELPEFELPFMPTLFPTEGEPYVFVAEPTPLAVDISNPFDSLSSPPPSSASSSSSTSSHDSTSTMPTELGDDDVSAKESVPSPPAPQRRPSLFRVMSEGKSYFIEAPMGSPRSSVYSFKSAKEEAPPSSAEPVLEIKLSR